MTELVNTKQYRLTGDFAFYDDRGSHLWREWPEGAIVTDQSEIDFLTARGAPVEKIEIDLKLSPPPIPKF